MTRAETIAALSAATDANGEQLAGARTERIWDTFVKSMVIENTPAVAEAVEAVDRAIRPSLPGFALLALYIAAERVKRVSPDMARLGEMDAAMSRLAFDIAGMLPMIDVPGPTS